MPHLPRVSIITPYSISSALMESLLLTVGQKTLTNHEQLIIDGQSHLYAWQAPVERCRGVPGIGRLRTDVNGGPAKARNLGICKALGRFLAYIDSDDLRLSDKLQASQAVWRAL